MNWCLSSVDAAVPAYVNRTYFMGFNEPNNAHNCHTDAAAVARAWGHIMALHPRSALVSPATAGNGGEASPAVSAGAASVSGVVVTQLDDGESSCASSIPAVPIVHLSKPDESPAKGGSPTSESTPKAD